jgi:hypothetical protein
VTGLAESPGRMLKLKAKAGKMNHDEHWWTNEWSEWISVQDVLQGARNCTEAQHPM